MNQDETNLVQVFDPMTDTWSTAAPIPTPFHSCYAVSGLNGDVYVIGGTIKPTPGFPSGQRRARGGRHRPCVQSDDEFMVGRPPIPETAAYGWELIDAAAQGPDGRLYAFAENSAPTQSLVFVGSPDAKSWTAVSEPDSLGAVGAAPLLDGGIIEIGGLTENPTVIYSTADILTVTPSVGLGQTGPADVAPSGSRTGSSGQLDLEFDTVMNVASLQNKNSYRTRQPGPGKKGQGNEDSHQDGGRLLRRVGRDLELCPAARHPRAIAAHDVEWR